MYVCVHVSMNAHVHLGGWEEGCRDGEDEQATTKNSDFHAPDIGHLFTCEGRKGN